ncbi:carbohydrate kinase family protein [Agaribacter marinus]|uniref:Fructokinase n=1 Tax=Agaribacter marinus TaxID=1431249 RepID=A0AA37SXN1_9ALTE|nr:carbohydrate kinase [Agaribacter marinus]GLR70409.1 fructokinase [Agaribacter marinus]
MKKLVCFGEALIDFLHAEQEMHGGLNIPIFKQFPGGAPANAAVAVAKLGGNAFFAGQVGDDTFGHFLRNALAYYGVNTTHTLMHPEAQTALAFVSLDHEGERSFSFYRQNTADVIVNEDQFPQTIFSDGDILHVCSNTLTSKDIANTTLSLASRAKSNHAIVSVDVNLRHNLWDTGNADIQVVNALLSLANIIKFSKEELGYLSDENDDAYIDKLLQENKDCLLIVVTDGAKSVRYFTPTFSTSLDVPCVDVVDTTCGGDSFIGGLLYCLLEEYTPEQVIASDDRLQHIIRFAIACGAHTVSRQGAFPALPTLNDVSTFLPIYQNQQDSAQHKYI